MTGGSDRLVELRSLLEALCEETIAPEQMARLEEMVLADPEAEAFYIEFLHVHAGMLRKFGGVLPGLGEEGREQGPRSDAASDEPEGMGRRPLPGWFRTASHSWRWRTAAAIAAAVLLVGLTALLWPKGQREREASIVAVPPPKVAPPRVAPAEGVAVVVQLARAVWEPEGGRKPTVGEILPASRLVLHSGRLTLTLLNGVMLTLEGPADLELISIDRVICHRGKVRARVPARVEGFVVSAPGSAVVDMGTEFGLNVDTDGKAQVKVFEGEADAALLDASGSVQRDRSVTEHRALEIDPRMDRFNEVEARSESFVQPPGLAIPPLALTPAYRDVVLETRPWGYWRFESIDGGAVPNEVAARPSLRATGPVRLVGIGNRSVALGSGPADQYLMMDGLWAPPHDPGYAVELWFCTEKIDFAALAGLFVPGARTIYKHLFYLELTARDRHSILLRPAAVRFLHRWPPADSGGDNLYSDHYVPYRWHHVVAQKNGDQMELYLDGVAFSPLSISPDRATEACRFIVGQLKPVPRPPGPWENRPFVGQIDELALYDRPLSAEEVRRHHALGTSGAGRPDREP